MATKKFNIQFEDIRRNSTPVSTAGFGDLVEDPDNPDEPFIDVDLSEEDPEKAITAAKGTSNGAEGADAGDEERDRKRAALRAKKESREAADEAIGEARAEVAQELNILHEKIDKLESAKGLTQVEEEYEESKAGIEAKMITAMEDGKSEDYAKLNSSLIELNGKMQEKRTELRVQEQGTAAAPEDLGGDAAGRQPANPRAVAFIQANEEWWSDPDHEDAVDYARRLDKKLVGMGYDPKGDRYWHAFNRNFDNKFKDLRIADDDEIELDLDAGGRGKGSRSPVHRPGSGGGASQGKAANRGGGDGGEAPNKGSSVVRLTAADKANMTRFLLDPSNPEHCRQYAMNKVPEERT